MKEWNLKSKKALVTGGTKGIGLAIVEQFLELGAEVLFTSRNQAEIDAIVDKLSNKGLVQGLKADVSSQEDRQLLVQVITEKWHGLDILVNNAGINIRKSAVAYSEDELMKVLQINLIGLFDLTRNLYPHLSDSGMASVINIASVAGMVDISSGAPYGMSKGGLLQLTRSLATEWADAGVRVNSVSPWYTKTPLTEAVLTNAVRMEKIINCTPMKRVAEADEMASAVSFLAMDHSSYITGQNITVDGGMMATGLYA